MKAWLLFAVVLVGCYQPVQQSAAERFNQESEALERLGQQLDPFHRVHLRATVEKDPQSIAEWKKVEPESKRLEAAFEKQRKRVIAARDALDQ